MDFGKYADYMALGYAAMAVLLGAMVLWIYLRYRILIRERDALEQLAMEERAGRSAEGEGEPALVQPGITASSVPRKP